ncbi:MAG: acyltransferase family protein [Candidatus Acidiferrales bacterium]
MDATTATPPSKARVPELDGLRGIAISLVLIFHYFFFSPAPDHHPTEWIRRAYAFPERFATLGWSGVDLFFVLSGFLIGGILLDARGSPDYFKTFYARRVFRILPIYYAWIAAYILAMALAGRFLETRLPGGAAWETWSSMAAQILFLQNFRTLAYSSAIGATWFQPTWSLAIEEQFYLIAPAVVRFLTRRRLYLFLGFVILSAPLLRLYLHYRLPIYKPGVLSFAYMLMPCRADALALGILAALLWRNRSFRDWLGEHGRMLSVAAAVFFVGVAALGEWAPDCSSLAEQSAGYTWLAIFYALVLLLVLSKPRGWLAGFTRIGWLRELGKVSYCMYLIHLAVGSFCGMLFGILRRTGSGRSLASNCVAIVLTYAIARVSWACFENPLLQKGHKYKY